MQYVVCAVRDRALDSFGTPMCLTAVGAAVRSFSDEINSSDPNSALAKHPEDFDLFQLGTYDSDTGLFNTGVPRQIAIGKDLLRRAAGDTAQQGFPSKVSGF